ncbi:unnamed protein product [Euphydryas editha]|uniref:Uncharacterized protein n=1 Tax=Euphydryas editha TaxID=104508 RepID=A0AAU9TW44_EUPED|nr:unnamed protein product [Euphydryas editha]
MDGAASRSDVGCRGGLVVSDRHHRDARRRRVLEGDGLLLRDRNVPEGGRRMMDEIRWMREEAADVASIRGRRIGTRRRRDCSEASRTVRMEKKSGLFAGAGLSLEGSCCLQIQDPPIKADEGSGRGLVRYCTPKVPSPT